MNFKYINYLFILPFSYAPWLSVWSQPQDDMPQVTAPVAAPLSEQSGGTTQPRAVVPHSEIRSAVERYSERVRQLEAEYGAWHAGLQEELIGLGQAWMNIGEYKDAISVFTRAMHIKRINEGLYSLSQQDVLKHIIAANIQLQDIEALTDNYAYLIWLYDNNYRNDYLHRVLAYQQAAHGHLSISAFTLVPQESNRHLVLAADLYKYAVEMIAAVKGPDDPALIDTHYGVVHASHKLVEPYGFLSNIQSHLETQFNSMRTGDVSLITARFGVSEYIRRELEKNPVPVIKGPSDNKYMISLIQKSYQKGRDALLRIIDIHEKNPHLPEQDYVNALVEMGDWYLRFLKRNHAESYYMRANQVRVGHTGDEQLRTLFDRPRPLGIVERDPEFESDRLRIVSSEQMQVAQESARVSATDPEVVVLAEGKYVIAEFTVTKYGKVSNIKIVESKPEDSYRFVNMARTLIKLTPFRPRMVNNELVPTEKVRMLYRFE